MKRNTGFTLIELLIVIAILGILAAIILVAVDPAKRLRQARNARRSGEVNSMLNAILNYTVDNAGTLPSSIQSATSYKMIGTCTAGAATPSLCPSILPSINDAVCANLSASLVDSYIAEIPVDPAGTSPGGAAYVTGTNGVGYYVFKSPNGRIEVGSCNPEDGVAAIKVRR